MRHGEVAEFRAADRIVLLPLYPAVLDDDDGIVDEPNGSGGRLEAVTGS